MNRAPSISVVTLTFNAARDLPRLLASLRAQTDHDFRFAVLDGASRDGTTAILAAARDIVTHFRSEPDNGFFDALNKALKVIETDYYLVMGADDQLAPDGIQNYRRAAALADADMVIGGVVAGRRRLLGYHPRSAWLGPGRMFTSHSVGTLFRTALHQRFGPYSLRYPIFADSLFMKRVAQAPGTRVVAGDFIAGEFNVAGGFSKAELVRSLCELWMIQRETGENPAIQYLLFQARLLRRLRQVLA